MPKFLHIPVLLNGAIEALDIKPDGVYVDATCGGGGHSEKIASSLSPKGRLVCLDQDSDAIAACKERLKNFSNISFVHANFCDIKSELAKLGIFKIDGVLADLGVSSYQLDTAERGFSFLHDGPLDMRMNTQQKLTAFQVVNEYSPENLKKILWEYGEEQNAAKIVHAIVREREKAPIKTTSELKEIIESTFPKKIIYGKGGVSKKTFQAIRIEVNGELEILKNSVEDFVDLLQPKGRAVIITFHSLEDRIVKNVFKDASTDCICPPKTPICICGHKAKGHLVFKKPVLPSEDEVKKNERSRSAKLRAFEKT